MALTVDSRKKRSKGGFTLLELLVVIAIVGVLSGVVLASLNTARAKARDAKRITEVQALAQAMQMHFSEYGEYPGVTNVWYTNNGGDWWVRYPSTTTNQSDPRLVEFYNDLAPYIPAIPKAIPQSRRVYIDTNGDCQTAGGGARIQYKKYAPNTYKMSVSLETDCESVRDDGGTSTCCSTITGSGGRSYEVYEVFTAGLESAIPLW